jgi:hypothetical protein
VHWAGARLAYAVCGVHVWGHGMPPHGKNFVFISRVVEKTSLFSIAIFTKLLELLALETNDATRLVVWQDCGPHYRSYLVLSSLTWLVLNKYRKGLSIHYGLEKHMKGRIDGLFGWLSRWKQQACKSHYLYELQDIKETWETAHVAARALGGEHADLEVVEFLPPPKKDVEWCLFALSSLPSAITGCHSWSFSLADRRRQSLVDRSNKKCATGIIMRCQMLPSQRCPEYMTGFPIIQDKSDKVLVVPVPLDDEVIAEGVVKPPENVKMHEGWRLAYRTTMPEHYDKKMSVPLRKKFMSLHHITDGFPEATRHNPIGPATVQAKARDAQRSKSFLATMKAFREE